MKANLNPGTRERGSIEIHLLFQLSLNFFSIPSNAVNSVVLLRLLKAFSIFTLYTLCKSE